MALVATISALALQALPAWTEARPDNGWRFLGINDAETSMTLTRPGPRSHLIWSRSELASPTNGVHSSMALYELDCANGKYRIAQTISYSSPNLGGNGSSSTYVNSWSYPGPGTIGEAIFQRGCGLRD